MELKRDDGRLRLVLGRIESTHSFKNESKGLLSGARRKINVLTGCSLVGGAAQWDLLRSGMPGAAMPGSAPIRGPAEGAVGASAQLGDSYFNLKKQFQDKRLAFLIRTHGSVLFSCQENALTPTWSHHRSTKIRATALCL